MTGLMWAIVCALLLACFPIASAASDLPAAPQGFDARREGIERGKTEVVSYESKTIGVPRKMTIYTPPGYSRENKYPVFYLLHGIGDDETGWRQKGSADVVLDNLYVEKKLVPMIVVMPNGRAWKGPPTTQLSARPATRPATRPTTTGRDRGQQEAVFRAFEAFEDDLLKDVIPYVESHYPVKTGRENRALAGLSMGGGQSLNFGLKHLDTFAWVGGFSSAPNTKPATVTITDPDKARKQLRLLWLSCGDTDGLLPISQDFHAALESMQVPHVWHTDTGGHTWPVWKNDLYLLAPMLFREKAGSQR